MKKKPPVLRLVKPKAVLQSDEAYPNEKRHQTGVLAKFFLKNANSTGCRFPKGPLEQRPAEEDSFEKGC